MFFDVATGKLKIIHWLALYVVLLGSVGLGGTAPTAFGSCLDFYRHRWKTLLGLA